MTRFVKIRRPLKFGDVVAFVGTLLTDDLLDPNQNLDRNIYLGLDDEMSAALLQVSLISGSPDVAILHWLPTTVRQQFRLVKE